MVVPNCRNIRLDTWDFPIVFISRLIRKSDKEKRLGKAVRKSEPLLAFTVSGGLWGQMPFYDYVLAEEG